MEKIDTSEQHHKSEVNRRSLSGVVIREPDQNATNNIVNTNNVNANARRDPDQLMPITNILRIMKRGLPHNAKVSEDATSILQECVSEYISFITSEANERCHCELRKTITAEDILYAHAKLGFEDYIGPLTLYLNKYRQHEASYTAVYGGPSVRHTAYFPERAVGVVINAPPSLPPPLPLPPPPPPINQTFQVDGVPPSVPPPLTNQTFQVDGIQQGFFNPTMTNDYYYFQNAPFASLGGGYDIGGSSSSNAEFPEPEAHPQPGFYPHDQEQFK
ncbi:hypothetical protein ACH5RR_038078 [Cinchona calisaya]|uniref:Transcription factor CBF/NF-Y/archaeal histone domain-containing protein n=1 Tax=Cinchona calisaya TaxID=153742 RepID=A0ABD2YC00_9GENT